MLKDVELNELLGELIRLSLLPLQRFLQKPKMLTRGVVVFLDAPHHYVLRTRQFCFHLLLLLSDSLNFREVGPILFECLGVGIVEGGFTLGQILDHWTVADLRE